MKVTITEAVGPYREDQTIDTDDSTAQWLIDHAYATEAEPDGARASKPRKPK